MVEKLKKINGTSWQPFFAGSLVVWVVECSSLGQVAAGRCRGLFAVFLFACYVCVALYLLAWKRKRDSSTVLGLILWGGFLLRAYYVLAAPYDITNHDIGEFKGFDTNESGPGHFGYIEYLWKERRLPDFDPRTRWSFYNPPGFYIVGAVVLGAARLCGVNAPFCYEGLQAITLFFASLTVWTGYRILSEFSVKGRWLHLFVALLSLHPFYSIMSVTLTNDCMSMYFMALAAWYTVRWQKSKERKHIVVVALATGLAMFTKLNAAVIAFGIGIVFACAFWERLFGCILAGKRREFAHLLVQFAVFLLISVPIGMFNPVRNMVNFKIPLAYVQQMGLNSTQYIPNQTVGSRLGIPSFQQMSYPFISYDTQVERNVWIQALRTALFDEIMPGVGAQAVGGSTFQVAAKALLWVSIFLAILANAALFWCLARKNTIHLELKLFLFVGYAALLASYAQFCMKEPFICTMSYRYIPISMFFPLVGAAVCTDGRGRKKKTPFEMALACSIVCFVGLSVIVDLCLATATGIKL